MPALSSTMTEGKVVTWLKSVGDNVKKGEALLVVESDKADMDVESFSEGILAVIHTAEGERANVGAPIAFIAETQGEVEAAVKKAASLNGAPAPAPAAAAPKPAPAAPAPAPTPTPTPVAAAPAAPKPAPAAAAAAPAYAPRADGRIVATPYARQLAKDHKVDLSTVGGSGPNGRITASDVERAAGRGPATSAPAAAAPAAAPAAASASAPAPAAAPGPAPAVKPTTVSELRGTTKPFTSLQQAVNKNMIASLAVPEFRVGYEMCTDKLDVLYQKLKPKGVTMTALLAKACGVALAAHPALYAAVTPDGQGVTYADHINVAVAVAMPDGGLITPVLKDADSTDIYQISRNWADLVKRARSKQLTPAEFTTGNFTISNLGMFGVTTFDAILPPGTAAILGIAASRPTVVATADGMIGVKKIMTVNLTADHRIVYGAQAAEFLQSLKQVIENPEQLVM